MFLIVKSDISLKLSSLAMFFIVKIELPSILLSKKGKHPQQAAKHSPIVPLTLFTDPIPARNKS
ncbi:hypothetical protein J2Z66_006177 [Paenibacillus eucommiae]|uniref:Uncharacterized protein n=1 Tax=Paenibacillus eucommiae TaxID=1355755 RepID=A0ABS4J3X0_9BACL|nr:hypothetical protein [Paenibacillus eucommiae]